MMAKKDFREVQGSLWDVHKENPVFQPKKHAIKALSLGRAVLN
jgi:hypothetical protein